MKKNLKKIARETVAVFLITTMAAGMTACGKTGASTAEAKEETAVAEDASAQNTVVEALSSEQINPEQVNPEVQIEDDAVETPDAQETAAETIEKPEPSDVIEEDENEPEEEEKEEEEEEEEKEDASEKELAILDEGIVFDGMELTFPIELDELKLGNWQIEYQNVYDVETMELTPGEIVLATMISPDYTDSDVKVTAEFGNYTDTEVLLKDIPLTGIYIKKGEGSEDAEPRLPEFVMPGGLTWGSLESEVYEKLGEASFSSGTGDEFDSMYENGDFLVEFAGMKETGVDYMVYCVE